MKLKQINMTPKKRRIRGPLLTNNVQHPSSTFLHYVFLFGRFFFFTRTWRLVLGESGMVKRLSVQKWSNWSPKDAGWQMCSHFWPPSFLHLATHMICGGKICREGLKEVSTRGGEEEWGKDGSMDPQERKQVLAFPFWWVIFIFGTITLFLGAGVCGHFREGRRRARTFCQEAISARRADLLFQRQEDGGGGVPVWQHDGQGGGGGGLLLLQPGRKLSRLVGGARGSGGRKWKWFCEIFQVVDIPSEMRSIAQFRTTLGHKTNSAFFDERNADFETVRHNNGFLSKYLQLRTKSRTILLTSKETL